MCGMCLPHCPTYHLTRDEAESPRGRISLIQGMSSGRLSYSPALAAHLDHCLACRACESVSPSGVRYGEIIAGGRALVGAPVRDISDFMNSITWPASAQIAPLPKKVAVHDPCTLTHVLRQHQAPYKLLARIPEAERVPLPDNRRCCGAAGSYMLTEPTMADALRAEKIAALSALQPDILVTSNIGCALHLRAGIAAAKLNIEVMHPITLLARQLRVSIT